MVCRELTKTHEEVVRGTLAELVAWAQGEVRGEVTLVLAGAPEPEVDASPAELVRLVGVREQAGLSPQGGGGRGRRRDRAAPAGRVRRRGRAAEERAVRRRPTRVDPVPRNVLTAVAWPYANGPRHIGHVAGFGVPSDVFSRYQRMAGNRVLMVSGTDEHGTPIQVQADKEGVTRPRARRPLQPGHRRGPAGPRAVVRPVHAHHDAQPLRGRAGDVQRAARQRLRHRALPAVGDRPVDRPRAARPLRRGHLPDLRRTTARAATSATTAATSSTPRT